MTHTITLSIKDIKAVSHAMANNDIRYYLNSICIEHNGLQTRIIATDGHRLHIVRVEHPDGEHCAPVQYLLPDTMVKTIIKCKAPRHDKRKEAVLVFSDGKVSVTLPDGTESIAKLIDGRFPDYSRVIPQAVSGEYACINQDYVTDALQGYRDYMESKNCYIALKHGGTGCAVLVAGNYLAVVMPMRGDISTDPDSFWHSQLAGPVAVPLPEGFEDQQGAVDYANSQAVAV
jgi:DNA polymerase-3 subunit beta